MAMTPADLARSRAMVKRHKFPDRVIADYCAMTIRAEGEQEYVLASDHDAAIAQALQEQREQDCKAVCPYCRKGVDHADVAYAACRKIRTGARG